MTMNAPLSLADAMETVAIEIDAQFDRVLTLPRRSARPALRGDAPRRDRRGQAVAAVARLCELDAVQRRLRQRDARRARDRVHPCLQPDPRRSAVHGRRRHAPRQADRAQAIWRGDRRSGRRFAPRAGVRGCSRSRDASRSLRPRRAGFRAGAGERPLGYGGRPDDGPRCRGDAVRPAYHDAAAAAQDRRADRLLP